ncbi:25282_t:CDS:2, partial [Gigaspora rosea]
FYPPPSILVRTQKKKHSYRIPDDYKVMVSWAKKNKTRNITCSINYMHNDKMQLKPCFKIKYDKDGFQTIESWQSVTHAANLFVQCVEQTRDYRRRSNVLQPLETLGNTAKRNRIKQISEKVYELSEKIKRQAYVRAMDFSRDAFRSIAKISSELDREYMINNEKLNLNEIMQNAIPLYVMDINIDNSTILETNNDEIHINDE